VFVPVKLVLSPKIPTHRPVKVTALTAVPAPTLTSHQFVPYAQLTHGHHKLVPQLVHAMLDSLQVLTVQSSVVHATPAVLNAMVLLRHNVPPVKLVQSSMQITNVLVLQDTSLQAKVHSLVLHAIQHVLLALVQVSTNVSPAKRSPVQDAVC
jgi:hypothetical protein